jgi:iron complex outermembrane receptor protein
MYRSLMLVLLGLWVAGSAFAAGAESSTVVMDEVVVTATRQEEFLSKVPANVTVVSESEIAQSPAETVPELLRSVAGVLVTDIAGNGRTYTVDLRGFGETASLNTLVLVDGRRINQADLSGVDWTLIPKERVARIEIVRGGRGSVLYGDNASGGVINIITKKGTQELNAAGKLAAGSYETFLADTSVSGATSGVTVAMNGNYRTSDGYRDNSDTEAKDVGLNLIFDASELLSLSLDAGYHEDDTSMPGSLSKSALNSGVSRKTSLSPNDYADTEDWYLQGGMQFYVTDSSYLDVDVSTRNREAEFNFFSVYGDYTGTTEVETLAFSPQLILREQLLGHDASILLGFDYEDAEEDIKNETSYIAKYEMSKESYGYFAHADLDLNKSLSASGGFRKDRAKFKFKPKDAGTSDSNTIDEDLYTFGVNYQFMGNISAYASYSKSFRYPVIDEFFNYYSNTVNSDLDAQVSDDFEVGMRHQCESGLSVGINLFRVVTNNEIFLNPATYANQNLDGDSIRQGVELSASKNIYDILFSGSYTFRDTDIDGGEYDGSELPGVPQHQWTLGAQKTFAKRIQLVLDGNYVGERRFISDFANDHGDMEDYFYLTSKLSYLLDKGSVYIAVNNILNDEYSEYGVIYGVEENFYPSPKINFKVGAEFRF